MNNTLSWISPAFQFQFFLWNLTSTSIFKENFSLRMFSWLWNSLFLFTISWRNIPIERDGLPFKRRIIRSTMVPSFWLKIHYKSFILTCFCFGGFISLLVPVDPIFFLLLLDFLRFFFFFLEYPFSSLILIWFGIFPKFFIIILIGKSIVSTELFLNWSHCVSILNFIVILSKCK